MDWYDLQNKYQLNIIKDGKFVDAAAFLDEIYLKLDYPHFVDFMNDFLQSANELFDQANKYR